MRRRFLKRSLLLTAAAIASVFFFANRAKAAPPVVKVDSPTWNTFEELSHLRMILKGFSIESILDIPAKDVQALQRIELGVKHYIGIASSRDEARALQAQFGSRVRTFIEARADVDPLPKVDLILCWDHLETLHPMQIQSALVQFKKSGGKFLLMRHCPEVEKNTPGSPINWNLPPYNLPEPIIQIYEKRGDRSLALWSIASI